MAHILIVEDNKDIALLYERIFRNHTTQIVDSAERAIECLNHQQYGLVVLDMHLEKVSGLEVLKHIREKDHTMRIFVISADDSLKYQALDFGIDLWMTKPIELDELMLKANQTLM